MAAQCGVLSGCLVHMGEIIDDVTGCTVTPSSAVICPLAENSYAHSVYLNNDALLYVNKVVIEKSSHLSTRMDLYFMFYLSTWWYADCMVRWKVHSGYLPALSVPLMPHQYHLLFSGTRKRALRELWFVALTWCRFTVVPFYALGMWRWGNLICAETAASKRRGLQYSGI